MTAINYIVYDIHTQVEMVIDKCLVVHPTTDIETLNCLHDEVSRLRVLVKGCKLTHLDDLLRTTYDEMVDGLFKLRDKTMMRG